eukprot:1139260-Pelagomonas_calceolata.AAC.10
MEGEEQAPTTSPSRPPLKPLLGDAGIEAVSGAVGSMLALLATYPFAGCKLNCGSSFFLLCAQEDHLHASGGTHNKVRILA